jgi:hypothetical protein
MAHQPLVMKAELLNSLKQMSDAGELMNAVIQSISLEHHNTDPELIQTLKQKMNPPSWLMETTNTVEGIIADEPIKLVINLSFKLDTNTLFKLVDQQKIIDPATIDKTINHLKSQPNGEALADIMLDSLLPHAYGLTQKIELK